MRTNDQKLSDAVTKADVKMVVAAGALLISFVGFSVTTLNKLDALIETVAQNTIATDKRLTEQEIINREQDRDIATQGQALKSAGLLSKTPFSTTIASGQSAQLTPTPGPTPVMFTYNYTVQPQPTETPAPTPEPTPQPVSGFVNKVLDFINL